jgi:hypothetical protein
MLIRRSLWCFSLLHLFVSQLCAQEGPSFSRTQEVSEVVVNNGNQAALGQLLLRAIEVESAAKDSAQAYFELRSFLEAEQVELVEAYFHLKQGAFGPLSTTLKTGRFALYPYDNRYFASHATANALLAFNLREASPLYPFSPFNVGKRPQKYFRFLLSDSVQTSALDTLLEIKFFPKVADGKSFSGTAWLNPRTNELVQVFLSCQHCVQQPFIALFHTDSLQNIDFQLQCAYGKRDNGAALEHLKAFYDITYLSSIRETNTNIGHYHGEASIQVYTPQTNTMQPHFDFLEGVDIYRKIMAFPYSAAYWAQNPAPYPTESQAKRNQLFYQKATISNELIAKRSIRHNRIFEHPFIPWSTQRVLLREELPENIGQPNKQMTDISPLYKLEVQLFYDLLETKDSLVLLSSCVIDPYQTYYKLSVDPTVNCFINMYFDLCEIERRKFELVCRKEVLTPQRVDAIYKDTKRVLDEVLSDFLAQVDRGQSRKAMLKWNEVIMAELGIDNLVLFSLYE